MMSLVRLMLMALALASTTSSFHPSESSRNQYDDKTLAKGPLLKDRKVPDLQVGCGDGNIREGDLKKKRIPSRRRRSYVPWSGQVAYSAPYQSISVWKPPTYALERPYYVPIFGVAGRPPIYFPPQPLRYNPGVPKDNPKKYTGPQYLPPKTPDIMDRFNDDRPIWDVNEVEQQTTTSSPSSNVIPTRLPRPPGGGVPPLIHNPTNGGSAPSGSRDTQFVPPSPRPRPSTPRPNEPTRCVWAIISCCSGSGQISYDCFEERGCMGAFWDNNPCESEYAKAAIAAALNYYN